LRSNKHLQRLGRGLVDDRPEKLLLDSLAVLGWIPVERVQRRLVTSVLRRYRRRHYVPMRSVIPHDLTGGAAPLTEIEDREVMVVDRFAHAAVR